MYICVSQLILIYMATKTPPPNGPSKTTNPSGPNRGNNPPSKPTPPPAPKPKSK